MKTTVVIYKRGSGYVADVQGQHGGGHQGVRCGLTPFDAATSATRYMMMYANTNPEGGVLVAPQEVMEHVPNHLREVLSNEQR